MKRFGVIIGALCLSATVAFAQRPDLSREPFVVNTDQLIRYLQLRSSQVDEVESINAYFIQKQHESMRAKAEAQDEKMYQAVYGNLKLMKRVLTDDQYRKYLTLLNVTNNNNRAFGANTFPEVYLADRVNE